MNELTTTTASDIETADPSAGLTPQQVAWCNHYARTFDATRAARLAGYVGNGDSLSVTGHRLLVNAKVRRYLDNLLKQTHLTPDEILARLGKQARANYTDYVTDDGIVDLSTDTARDNATNVRRIRQTVTTGSNADNSDWQTTRTEIDLVDSQAALTTLARVHGLLRDRVDVDLTLDADQAIDRIASLLASAASRARGDAIEGESREV